MSQAFETPVNIPETSPQPVDLLELLSQFATGVSIGLDIGGTLTKVVYFAPDYPDDTTSAGRILEFITSSNEYGLTGIRDESFSFSSKALGGNFHFIKFQTNRMENFLQVVKENRLTENSARLFATGGGAHKFETMFSEYLNIQLIKRDEMDCLVQGIHFLFKSSSEQCFFLENANFSKEAEKKPINVIKTKEPFLLVNIGSGVSILRVNGPNDYLRVGGSSLGGSTFLALTKLLTNASTFKDAIQLAESGDSTNVDMLVRDIYGRGYDSLGLSPTVVASSFGKMISPDGEAAPSDLAKAALIMITNNIGSIAYLHSKVEQVKSVVFAGNFLEGNEMAMRTLAFAMDFWSKGSLKAVFLRNVGYSGAVGALISTVAEELELKMQSSPSPATARRKTE